MGVTHRSFSIGYAEMITRVLLDWAGRDNFRPASERVDLVRDSANELGGHAGLCVDRHAYAPIRHALGRMRCVQMKARPSWVAFGPGACLTSRSLSGPGLAVLLVASGVAKVVKLARLRRYRWRSAGGSGHGERKGPDRGSRNDRAVDPGQSAWGQAGAGAPVQGIVGYQALSAQRRERIERLMADAGIVVQPPLAEAGRETIGWSCPCRRRPRYGKLTLIHGLRPSGSSI